MMTETTGAPVPGLVLGSDSSSGVTSGPGMHGACGGGGAWPRRRERSRAPRRIAVLHQNSSSMRRNRWPRAGEPRSSHRDRHSSLNNVAQAAARIGGSNVEAANDTRMPPRMVGSRHRHLAGNDEYGVKETQK